MKTSNRQSIVGLGMFLKILKWRLFGLALVAFCAMTWAWMLGLWDSKYSATLGGEIQKWSSPGILALPAILSLIAGITGLLFLLGVFPLPQALEKDVHDDPS